MPSPSDDGEAGGNKRAKGSSGAVVGRWQETPVRSSSAKELRAAATAPQQPGGSAEKGASPSGPAQAQKQARKLREPGAVDVLQFLKYFHLVPAQVGGPLCARLSGSTPVSATCMVRGGTLLAQRTSNFPSNFPILCWASVHVQRCHLC